MTSLLELHLLAQLQLLAEQCYQASKWCFLPEPLTVDHDGQEGALLLNAGNQSLDSVIVLPLWLGASRVCHTL